MLRRSWDALAHGSADPVTSALGHLEREVMEIVWRRSDQSVREVKAQIDRGVAYTTVMTTLDRLFKKGLVRRHLLGRAFVYTAASSREQLAAALTTGFLQGMLAGGSEAARPFLSHLVEAVGDGHSDLLDELERLVRAKRQRIGLDDDK